MSSSNDTSAGSNKAEENPWNEKNKEKFESKQYSEYYDPCQEAASRSIKCLHRNGGDKDMCGDYFQAYRDCKKQWLEQRKAEKRKNSKMRFFD